MRATILIPNQRYRLITGRANLRLERFREHLEDRCIFYKIERKVQIQIQIVLISAYVTLFNRCY